MDNIGIWKLIKIGFWLGIGFIIPQLVVLYSGTVLTMLAMPTMVDTVFDSEYEGDVSSFTSGYGRVDQIEIISYREQKNGTQLLILGSIKNVGDSKASSIQLEAEFMDENGDLVYECSEYINSDLKSDAVENFQIKCGCGKNPVPKYSKLVVRVVSASSY